MPSSVSAAENDDRNEDDVEQLVIEDAEAEQQGGDHGANRQHDEPRRERKHQRFHGTPRAIPVIVVGYASESQPSEI